eukprot:2090377-Pyramimonas_sp.AAC.1
MSRACVHACVWSVDCLLAFCLLLRLSMSSCLCLDAPLGAFPSATPCLWLSAYACLVNSTCASVCSASLASVRASLRTHASSHACIVVL